MARNSGPLAPPKGATFPVNPKVGDQYLLTENQALSNPVRVYGPGFYRCSDAAAFNDDGSPGSDAVWKILDPPEVGYGLKKRATGINTWDINPGIGLYFDEDQKLAAKLKSGGGIIGSLTDGLSVDPAFAGGSSGAVVRPISRERIVRGVVAGNGAITRGTGFTVTKISTGRYRVDFSPVFSGPVVVTVGGVSQTSGGYSATDVNLDNEDAWTNAGAYFQVQTTRPDGSQFLDAGFSFVASLATPDNSQFSAGEASPWTPLTLASPWASIGGSTPAVRRAADGKIEYRGLISGGQKNSSGGGTSTFVAALPVQFRPATTQLLLIPAGATGYPNAAIYVTSAGQVYFVDGPALNSGDYLALGALSYMAADGPLTPLSPTAVTPEPIPVVPITLASGITAFDTSAFNAPTAWKGADNVVRLNGLLRTANALPNNSLMGVLPVGYRPAKTEVLTNHRNPIAVARLDVRPDGGIYYLGPGGAASSANDYFALDGLSFTVADGPKAPAVRVGPIENTKAVVLPPALVSGTTQYANNFEEVEVWKDADGRVHVEGLLRGVGGFPNQAVFFNLPPGYRPSAIRVMKCLINGVIARVDINPDGSVRLNNTGFTGDSYAEFDFHFMSAGGPVQAAVGLGYTSEPIEVATLPTSPANGTIVDLVVDSTKGLVYRCKYDERITSSSSKWRVLGPARDRSTDFKSGPFNFGNTGNVWTAMNGGPALTLPRGIYALTISAGAYPGGSGSGDTVVAPKIGSASVNEADRLLIGAIAGISHGTARELEILVPADGTVVAMQGKTNGAQGGVVIDAYLAARPLLLG